MEPSKFLTENNKQVREELIGENIIKHIYLLRDWAKEQCAISLVNNQNLKIEILKRDF